MNMYILKGWILTVVVCVLQERAVSADLTQSELNTLAESLAVRAEVTDNLRENRYNDYAHSVIITLENSGDTSVPSSGWVLYFHSMYLVFPKVFPKNMSKVLDIGNMKVNMIQGDLYSMEPVDGFVELKPGEKRDFIIDVAVWSISRTDFMPHWYVTSTNEMIEPRIVKATNSMNLEFVKPLDDVRQWKRFNFDRYNPFTAQARMRRLQVLNTRKVEKLVIPTPQDITVKDGPMLTINAQAWTIYNSTAQTYDAADYLAHLINITLSHSNNTMNVIVLKITPSIGTKTEAYHVNVSPEGKTITLEGRDADGLFNAVQTLYSILIGYNYRDIPNMDINDEPRFHYRGMYVDIARNFHSMDDLKRLMSAMAMYKLNKLHIHLGDDEGWRLEIPDLPELTEVGGQRCHDMNESICIIPQFGSGPFTNSSGSGFLTSSDYKNLLKYAVERHIEIVPEFDMPGHAHAAIASMEQRYRKLITSGNETAANEFRLTDPDDKSVYISVQQWMDNAINPCLESTYKLIEKVLDHVIELHIGIQPLKTYHFGGDEVAGGAWTASPRCDELFVEFPEYNVTKGLKKYFDQRVSNITATRGVGMRGWEDGFIDQDGNPFPLESMDNDKMSANAWDNVWEWGAGPRAHTLANAGYQVVMSQATMLYFDHPYEPDPEERGLYWATRFTDTWKTFGFLPDSLYDNIYVERSGAPTSKAKICGDDMSKCPPLVKKENIIGMQGHLWSETIRTSENFDYMIFPRMLAMAERAWHKAEFEEEGISAAEKESRLAADWKAFANTLGHKELLRLDGMGVKYRVPPPGGRVGPDNSVHVSTTFPGLVIQFSRDGGATWSNITPETTLTWQNGGTLHLRTISADGTRYSRSVQLFQEEPLAWTDQPTIDYIAENVDVNVNVIDNLDKDNGYVPMNLELTNRGQMDITAGTWKIYFYSVYLARNENLTCGLTVGHVNGATFYLTPTNTAFPGIKANETLKCTYYNKHWVVARTDIMPNWYVGSTGMIAKVLKATVNDTLPFVGPFDVMAKWKRTADDKYNPYTPEIRYDRNKIVHTDLKHAAVVPTPSDVSVNEASSVRVKAEDGWVVINSQYFEFESKYVAEKMNISLKKDTRPADKFITFVKEDIEESDPEAYHLSIDPTSKVITITAENVRGGMHGAQTLISLAEGTEGQLMGMTIKDKPRFRYRGVMVDTARNFKPKEWMFKFLEVMSMYKLNTLHFHVADNEAWRVEIAELPELTQIGSQRCQRDYADSCLTPQLGSGPDNTFPGSGFYSIQDYRDILKYAYDRHINVIPEVESPGHSVAAVNAMRYRESKLKAMKIHDPSITTESMLLSDETFDNDDSYGYKWKGLMSPCLNSTYRFIEKVIDGFIELHQPVSPLKAFHIGGDEIPEGVWERSPACHAMMNKDGLSHDDLQRKFVKEVAGIVSSRNLTFAAWEDGVYANNKPYPVTDLGSKDVFVYPWDNQWGLNTAQRASEFADAGYQVILPSATHLYLDHPYEPDPEERGFYWAARFIDTQKTFGFMPENIFANADVTRMGDKIDVKTLCKNKPCPMPTKTENIIGMEVCMFSENIRTEEQFHYMGFPRILALAERAWHKAPWEDNDVIEERNKQRKTDWDSFATTLGYKELPRLEKNGIQYRVPPPGAMFDDNTLKVTTGYPNHEVDYSIDAGKTWTLLKGDKFFRPYSYTIHLRTRSKHLNRTSRVVQIKSPITSAADNMHPSYVVAGFIVIANIILNM